MLSEAGGVLILVFSGLTKLPQIVAILRQRSVEGLSFAMFVFMAYSYAMGAVYGVRMGYPFIAFGENAILLFETLVIMMLHAHYSQTRRARTLSLRRVAAAAAPGVDTKSDAQEMVALVDQHAAAATDVAKDNDSRDTGNNDDDDEPSATRAAHRISRWQRARRAVWRHRAQIAEWGAVLAIETWTALCLTPLIARETIAVLFATSIAVSVVSKLPQIAKNFRERSTGVLDWFMFAMQAVGNIIRMYTTAELMGSDALAFSGYATGLLLNCIILAQIYKYRGRSAPPPSPQMTA